MFNPRSLAHAQLVEIVANVQAIVWQESCMLPGSTASIGTPAKTSAALFKFAKDCVDTAMQANCRSARNKMSSERRRHPLRYRKPGCIETWDKIPFRSCPLDMVRKPVLRHFADGRDLNDRAVRSSIPSHNGRDGSGGHRRGATSRLACHFHGRVGIDRET